MTLKVSGYQSSLIAMCWALLKPLPLHLPASESEWQQWYELVVLNRIETQVVQFCLKNHISIPDPINHKLNARAERVRQQNQLRRSEAEILFRKLHEEKIDFIILKGNAIAEDIYHNLDYKQMNDFDLLFKKADLDKIYLIYNKMGYLSAASLNPDFRHQEKHSHHWPPFFSRNLNLFIGTHWNLVPPFSKVKITEEVLWQNPEIFNYDHIPAMRLRKEVFLLHLCIHLSPFKLGLKELADVFNFVFAYQNQINWSEFQILVNSTHSQDAVYRAFSLIESLIEDAHLNEMISILRPHVSPHVLDEISKRTQPSFKTLHLRTSHVSKIEKNYGFFSLSDDPFEKAYFLFKMWKNYLLPPLEHRFRLCHELPSDTINDNVRVTLLAIRQINRSFVQDLGTTVFVVITIRHHLELAKSIIKKLLGFRCEGLAKKANRLGLPLQDLKALSQLE